MEVAKHQRRWQSIQHRDICVSYIWPHQEQTTTGIGTDGATCAASSEQHQGCMLRDVATAGAPYAPKHPRLDAGLQAASRSDPGRGEHRIRTRHTWASTDDLFTDTCCTTADSAMTAGPAEVETVGSSFIAIGRLAYWLWWFWWQASFGRGYPNPAWQRGGEEVRLDPICE